MRKQYGDKYFSKRNGKTMDHIRSKTRYGESEKAMGRKKTRFTIAGPTPTTGGILNAGEYSIENTTGNLWRIEKRYITTISTSM
ncbi:MAG: hypothetical protein IJU93_01870 [Lachnospiraceae bacterium]|nr:hypothetical protein [Lachnospiraceae bacterium]